MRLKIILLVYAIPLALLTAACGFEPMYGENSATKETLTSVEFADPKSSAEFVFLDYVEQEMIRVGDPKYRVDYNVAFGQGIEVRDAVILRGTVDYRIIRISNGDVIASGVTRAIVNQGNLAGPQNQFRNIQFRSVAEEQLLRQLARETYLSVASRLAACAPSC
jgi:hypothetical protein